MPSLIVSRYQKWIHFIKYRLSGHRYEQNLIQIQMRTDQIAIEYSNWLSAHHEDGPTEVQQLIGNQYR